jgi:hypothetical protein
MSAVDELLGVLGLETAAEEDSPWGARPSVRPAERRRSPRHPASPNKAYLGWWKDKRFHSAAARFRDVSAEGAKILTRTLPSRKHIWISLARPVETRWYPAQIVWVRESSVSVLEVGIAFQIPGDPARLGASARRAEIE